MENYEQDTNSIDWLFVPPDIQNFIDSGSNHLNGLTTEQTIHPSYGIEPRLITKKTNSNDQSLNTPTDSTDSTISLCTSSNSNTLSNEGGNQNLSQADLVTAIPPKIKKRGKRQRRDESSGIDDNEAHRSMLEEEEEKMAKVVQQLVNTVPVSHPLCSIGTWSCSREHCFARTPLPDQPLDYFKDPFIFGKFAVRIFDPSKPPSSADVQLDSFSRPSGRSIHLIVTEMPLLLDSRQLDRGFAIVIAARRVQQSWKAVCLISYENTTTFKARARTNQITFRGNLEHCKGENGQRFWGQRSSHIRKTKRREAFKPLRIAPKGPVGMNMVEEYCFFVGLFDVKGFLLKHVDGSGCLAQSNVVRFEGRKTEKIGSELDEKYAGLMREIKKLSFFERADLSTIHTLDEKVKTMLAATDEEMLERIGVKPFLSERPPDSARELSKWMPEYLASFTRLHFEEHRYNLHAEQQYKFRLQAVARQIGRHHSDPSLVDAQERNMDLGNTIGAESRYFQILAAGIDDAIGWLHANGITKPNIHAVAARAELTGFVMRDLRFKSKWIVAVNNIYPDRILVDENDCEVVHCLANTTYEAEIALRDRMAPLARLAFCSKIPRDELKENILIPYCQGFLELFPALAENKDDILQTQIGPPYSSVLVDEDKFFIALHAMLLDFFLYWIRFRSVESVKKIAKRLLEDDEKFNPWFFEPSRLVKFA